MFDRKLLYTLISIGAVVIIAVTLGHLPGAEPEPPGEAVSSVELGEPQSPATEPEDAPPGYILREHDGYIAVFRSGEAEPQLILNTQVKFLPDYDRVQIAQGIPVETLEELGTLIEDYTS